jgi:single-strand DNA-binding protein
LGGYQNLRWLVSTTATGDAMRGFNQALLLGRLTVPPEELQTKNGKLFIKATIAVTVAHKSAEGVSEERTSFVPATIFGRQAEVFLKYVQKGDTVHLAGRLDANEWKTESGEKRLSLSFIVEQLTLLPNDRARQQAGPQPKAPARAERPSGTRSKSQPGFDENGDPDDIPF